MTSRAELSLAEKRLHVRLKLVFIRTVHDVNKVPTTIESELGSPLHLENIATQVSRTRTLVPVHLEEYRVEILARDIS